MGGGARSATLNHETGSEVIDRAGYRINGNTLYCAPGGAAGRGAVDDVIRRTIGAESAVRPDDIDFARGIHLRRDQGQGSHAARDCMLVDERDRYGGRPSGAAVGGLERQNTRQERIVNGNDYGAVGLDEWQAAPRPSPDCSK